MKTKETKHFWDWVTDNIEKLTPDNITDEYIELLDSEIKKLGDFSWEIGFDERVNKNFLTISPEGDPELLVESKFIVDQAPNIKEWIFYSAKPPKQWKLIFDLVIENENVKINANKWQYVLYKYPDNVYDLVIKVPLSYKPYEEYFYEIGNIAVTGEFGEAFVIEYINDIDLVYEFNEKEHGKEKDFNHLKEELLK